VRLHEHALRDAAAGDHLPAERHARTLRSCLVQRICLEDKGISNHLVRDSHFFCLVV
jgi:hypothetical protein